MPSQRKLAAIMFTDIEGYTALMQKSEEQAIQLRNKHREVFQKEIENHEGKILHYYGDGTLSVFDSAVKAVECGIAIQLSMQEDPVVPLRIGVHTGDIVFTDDDIIGDGVNVASRIESLAVPNSILISDKVFDEIKNHSAISTKYLKSYLLKNVERPVGVYAVTNSGLTVPEAKQITGKIEAHRDPVKFLRSSGKKIWVPALLLMIALLAIGYWMRGQWDDRPVAKVSKVVAVVPFETAFEEEYFQEGMTRGLIKELSKIEGLLVIDHKTTRFYAGLSLPFVDIKEDLPEVDYVVQGKVSRESNLVKVDLELRKSDEEDPIWTQTYSRDISEIRKLWSEAARDLAIPMKIDIPEDRMILFEGFKSVRPEVYELYLKGNYHLSKHTPEDIQKGMIYLHEAVDKNPADAYAYASLAEGYITLGHGPAAAPGVYPKAKQAALRAIQLDSTLADGWAALSHYETYFGMNWEHAEQAFKRANKLNPNLAMNHYHRAWYLILFGRKQEAIKEHILAKNLDPLNPSIVAATGLLYAWVGDYEKALQEVGQSLKVPGFNESAWGLGWTSAIYNDLEKYDEALEFAQKASEISPRWKYLTQGVILIKSGRINDGKQIIKELELMQPTAFGALCLGFMYATLGDADNAIRSLEYEDKHGLYPWIRVWPGMGLESLYDDPRFLELLREMKLPNPEKLRPDFELTDAGS